MNDYIYNRILWDIFAQNEKTFVVFVNCAVILDLANSSYISHERIALWAGFSTKKLMLDEITRVKNKVT
jgi:hypothetical protein